MASGLETGSLVTRTRLGRRLTSSRALAQLHALKRGKRASFSNPLYFRAQLVSLGSCSERRAREDEPRLVHGDVRVRCQSFSFSVSSATGSSTLTWAPLHLRTVRSTTDGPYPLLSHPHSMPVSSIALRTEEVSEPDVGERTPPSPGSSGGLCVLPN